MSANQTACIGRTSAIHWPEGFIGNPHVDAEMHADRILSIGNCPVRLPGRRTSTSKA